MRDPCAPSLSRRVCQLGEPSMAPKKPEPEPEPEEAEEAAEPETGSSAFVFADGSKYGRCRRRPGSHARHCSERRLRWPVCCACLAQTAAG